MIYKKAKKKRRRRRFCQWNSSRARSHQVSRPWARARPNNKGPTHLFSLSGPWRPRAASRRRRGGAEAREMAAPGTTRRRGKRRRSLPAGSSIRDSSPPSCRRTGSTSSRCPSCTAFLRTFDIGPLLLLSPHMGMVVLDFSFRRVRRCQ